MELADRSSPGDRGSVHDLSYNFTRFSVVDSMLSSLSELPSKSSILPPAAYHTHDFTPAPNDMYSSPQKQPTTSNTGRRRGHTQSSSMSDCDPNVDDIASHYADYHTKARQGSKPQIRPGTGLKSSFVNCASTSDASKHIRGTVTRGSKGSGSSSVDLGYKTGSTRTIPPHRAASFDHGYSPQNRFAHTEKHEHPVPIDYTIFDAAPTPTIPGGPRRPSEPVSPLMSPPPTSAPKQKGAPSRRNSIKSSTGKGVKKSKSSVPVNHDVRDQAKQFVQYTATGRNGPSSAAGGAAPSPTVATIRKTYPSPQLAPKEPRPGFFRRVFGSSKHDKPAHQEEMHRPPSPAAVRQTSLDTNGNRPRTQPSQQYSISQFKSSSSRPPTQDASMSGPSTRDFQPPMPPLRKAHSSFFRRNKKPLSDHSNPPIPTLLFQPHQTVEQLKIAPSQQSPGLQSLRGAMAPFLADNQNPTSPQDMFFDSREVQDENVNLAAYSLPSKTIRVVTRSGSRQGTHGENPGLAQTLNVENMKKHPAAETFDHGSFLVDSSSNEAVSNSSPDGFDDMGTVRRKGSQRASDPPWNAKSNEPPRRANIGEKRGYTHMVDSNTNHFPTHLDLAQTSHFMDDDEEDRELAMQAGHRDSIQKFFSRSRVWLDPASDDEKSPREFSDSLRLALPQGPTSKPIANDASSTSESDLFVSASSLPTLQVDNREVRMSKEWSEAEAAKAIIPDEMNVTADDRERAQMIFDGDEELVPKSGAAAWLGQTTHTSSRTRKAYMELFDWSGTNILAAFRELCSKLVVKAESQQLDRVIDAFSERWCDCNPNHGFKDTDVVHTITFSILMLNTDLHMADLDTRMTRSQFVKNTLPTLRSIADAATDDETEAKEKQRQAREHIFPWESSSPARPPSPSTADQDEQKELGSIEVKRNRLSMRPTRNDSYDDAGSSANCNVLVKAPYEGAMKGWEFQVEIVLKEFYNSIRNQRLPLHGHIAASNQAPSQTQTGLSVMTSALRRTPSVLSKAPSENTSYRGRSSENNRYNTGRFGSKNRSRPRIYPSSTIGSSRTSLDDQSVWSPAGSTWSKYSLGKTQTSMSVESFGTHFGQGDYQQAIGFANALSQAIIREEGNKDNASEDINGRIVPLLEDDTLELAGPPWAKEGIVKHKHHLESLEKKAKDRNWMETFAVIEKGWMKLFSFSAKSKSMRQRAKSRAASSGSSVTAAPVGGGNWADQAELLNQFLLRQTIASALPSPGYSKSRPHVFALSLPTGAVHLFQVGTADIVREFVTTANYWSARLSKQPLIGGISNIEYGWGENVLNPALMLQRPESTTPGQTPGTSSSNQSGFPGRSSITSPATTAPSYTSSRRSDDQTAIGYKLRLPGDKVTISDWSPPTQSMMASQLMEVDQLKELSAYVNNVEEELKKHNELRPLMGMAFSSRHPNAAKAMANWEKKSAYLLREIVKFKTYVDSLRAAQTQKDVLEKEREMRAKEKAEWAAAKASETTQEASPPAPDIVPSVPSVPQSLAAVARPLGTSASA